MLKVKMNQKQTFTSNNQLIAKTKKTFAVACSYLQRARKYVKFAFPTNQLSKHLSKLIPSFSTSPT